MELRREALQARVVDLRRRAAMQRQSLGTLRWMRDVEPLVPPGPAKLEPARGVRVTLPKQPPVRLSDPPPEYGRLASRTPRGGTSREQSAYSLGGDAGASGSGAGGGDAESGGAERKELHPFENRLEARRQIPPPPEERAPKSGRRGRSGRGSPGP